MKDALQEVFIIVSTKLDQLDPTVKPTTWLHGIAVRVAANQRRKVQRKREDLTETPDEAMPADPAADPEAQVRQAQARQALAEMLASLPAEQRIVFELFELEEMTCPAIAASLAIPLGTTYTRLRAARAGLLAWAAAHPGSDRLLPQAKEAP